MWINLNDDDIEKIKEQLQSAVDSGDKPILLDVLQAIATAEDGGRDVEQDNKYITLAREEYQSDGAIEIDDGATVSYSGDGGAYVMAWLYVEEEDEEEEDDEEDDQEDDEEDDHPHKVEEPDDNLHFCEVEGCGSVYLTKCKCGNWHCPDHPHIWTEKAAP